MSSPDSAAPSGANASADDTASPCVGVCRIDESRARCEGCLRTLEEIAAWGRLDAAAKRALLARLGERRRQPMPSSPGSAPSSAITAAGFPGKASRGDA